MYDDLIGTLSEHVDDFVLFILLPLLFILVILYGVYKLRQLKYKMQVAKEGFYSTRKMEMQMKKIHLEELKKAALALNDEQKERLGVIDRENALLAQKEIFMRNEIEARLQKLEHMKELTEGSDMLRKINEQEEQFLSAGNAPAKKSGFFRKKQKE